MPPARIKVAASENASSQRLALPDTRGSSRRSRAASGWYDSRPSSQIQTLLTSGFSRGVMRKMRSSLTHRVTLQPRAQPPHTEGSRFRNHTRAWKRNSLSVRAPTGQTSTVLPEYGLSSCRPGKTPMMASSPRLKSASSPVFDTSSQKRMQRVHLMQRSSSKTTCGPRSTALRPCCLSSSKRLYGRPWASEYSCSRHSPAWSQMGQSRGWLMSRNSIIPARASSTWGERVRTTIPSATCVEQAICSLGAFSISTRHMRQLPATDR
jgi:hypothetical protein